MPMRFVFFYFGIENVEFALFIFILYSENFHISKALCEMSLYAEHKNAENEKKSHQSKALCQCG